MMRQLVKSWELLLGVLRGTDACRCTAALMIVGCALAASPCSSAQEFLDLPEGVIHVALPPGTVKMEYTVKSGKPLLRLSAGKAVIEARTVFMGDGKAATQFEATKEGIHWPSAKGAKGFVIDGEIVYEPGPGSIVVCGGDFLTVNQLKPGSVYVTTPSIRFEFRREGIPNGRFPVVKPPQEAGARPPKK